MDRVPKSAYQATNDHVMKIMNTEERVSMALLGVVLVTLCDIKEWKLQFHAIQSRQQSDWKFLTACVTYGLNQ